MAHLVSFIHSYLFLQPVARMGSKCCTQQPYHQCETYCARTYIHTYVCTHNGPNHQPFQQTHPRKAAFTISAIHTPTPHEVIEPTQKQLKHHKPCTDRRLQTQLSQAGDNPQQHAGRCWHCAGQLRQEHWASIQRANTLTNNECLLAA